MTFGHGGNIYETARLFNCRPSDIVDMSSNINPLGPPPGLLEFLKENMGKIVRLPEIDNSETINYFAGYLGINPARVLAGNGTTQFIYSIPRILDSKNALIIGPTYSDYQDSLKRNRIPATILSSLEPNGFQPDLERVSNCLDQFDTVYLCNPNNPTGVLIDYDELYQLCRSHPQVTFIIDESYLPFVINAEKVSMLNAQLPNVIVLLSISKIFGIPGLRIGFLIAGHDRINQFKSYLLPWSINSLAQEAVRYLADHKNLIDSFVQKARIYCEKQRHKFHDMFDTPGEIKLYPAKTPFILIKLPPTLAAREVRQHLAEELILIRNCDNFRGLSDRYIRISLKTPEANQLIAARLNALVNEAVSKPDLGRMAC
jgi:threonine-phosphate decarboxylase